MKNKKDRDFRCQYFQKIGKKYVPVNNPIAYEGLTKGAWLVIVEDNCKSIRTAINPKFIELEAALRYLEDGLCKAISKVSEVRSRSSIMTEKERRAWKEFRRIMGKDMPTYLEYASNQEIAQAGCEYIRQVMTDNNCDIDKIAENYKDSQPKKFTNPILSLEM